MKHLIRWTLWQKRWFIFWWCLGIVFFIFLTLIFYPTIKDQSAQLNKSFGQLPQTAKQLFTDTSDLFSPVGYLSSQLFYLMLPLLLSVLGINLGMSLLGKEERDNTIEMLLARPLSRRRLLLGKAGAGLLIMIFIGLVNILFTALMCRLVKLNVPTVNILQAGGVVTLMAICIGSVTFMLTAMGRAGRAASIGISALFALGGYIVVSLADSVSWLGWPAKVFPFNYYHASQLLGGGYDYWNLVYFVAVAAGCVLISIRAFSRRDLAGD